MPCIDGMLERRYISCCIITITGGSVYRNNLVNRHQAPFRHVQVADQFVPLLEAVFPTMHHGITTVVGISTIPIGNTAQITERQGNAGDTGGTKLTFMQEEGE